MSVKWSRNCPKCGEEIPYSTKYTKTTAEKRNTKCGSCAMTGRIFSKDARKNMSKSKKGIKRKPFADETRKRMSESREGMIFSDETRKRMSESRKGKKWSKEVKKKISESKLGKNNPMYGKCAYDIWVEKYGKEKADKRLKRANLKKRLSAIKRIEKQNGQIIPNSNPNATRIIRAKAKELGITDLRDAETPGGEFYIKKLGYFVDGRSEEKNIVFEYYEKAHKYKKERDERRNKK